MPDPISRAKLAMAAFSSRLDGICHATRLNVPSIMVQLPMQARRATARSWRDGDPARGFVQKFGNPFDTVVGRGEISERMIEAIERAAIRCPGHIGGDRGGERLYGTPEIA